MQTTLHKNVAILKDVKVVLYACSFIKNYAIGFKD